MTRIAPLSLQLTVMNQLGLIRITIIVFCVSVAAFEVGCRRNHSDDVKQIRSRHTQLINEYLRGDVTQARESLRKAIELVEQTDVLTSDGQINMLAIDYFRLYALENREGNKLSARRLLAQARGLQIQSLKMADVPTEEINRRVDTYDPERVLEEVDRIDENQNNGNLPRYVQLISEREHPQFKEGTQNQKE